MPTLAEKLAKTSNNQRRILKELRQMEGLPTITQLAVKTKMHKSSVSRDVKKLKEFGLVRTERRGRETFVLLTSEGLEVFSALKEPTAEVVKRSFKDIFARAENTADEVIGEKLRLPLLRDVRKRIEEQFNLPPLEKLLEGEQGKYKTQS